MIIVNKLAKAVYGDEIYATEGVDWTKSCTGKSTAKILAIISEALANPGRKVKITEGKSAFIENRPGAIVDQTKEVIGQLGLRFAHVNPTDNTLSFNIFEDVPAEDAVELMNARLIQAITSGNFDVVDTLSKAIQRLKFVN